MIVALRLSRHTQRGLHSALATDCHKGLVGDSLDLIEGDGVVASIVETGSSRGLVAGHLLGNLEFSPVLKVGRDAGGTKTVSADLCSNAGGRGAALNHHVDVGLGQGSAVGQLPMSKRRKQRSGRLTTQA